MSLSIFKQGIRGGSYRDEKVGFVAVCDKQEKLLSFDSYTGAGDTYKERPEAIICVFDGENDCIWEGTHSALVKKLKST